MPRPNKMKAIEASQGRPMADILRDLYAEYGTVSETAQHLGVAQSTVSYWMLRLGLRVRRSIGAAQKLEGEVGYDDHA